LADLRATNALFDSIRAGVPLMETGISESMIPKIYPQHGHVSFFTSSAQRGVLDVPVGLLKLLVWVKLPGTDRSMIRFFPSCLRNSLVGTLFLVGVRVHRSQPAECPKPPLPLPPAVERNWALLSVVYFHRPFLKFVGEDIFNMRDTAG
jgi:hypothetical protein